MTPCHDRVRRILLYCTITAKYDDSNNPHYFALTFDPVWGRCQINVHRNEKYSSAATCNGDVRVCWTFKQTNDDYSVTKCQRIVASHTMRLHRNTSQKIVLTRTQTDQSDRNRKRKFGCWAPTRLATNLKPYLVLPLVRYLNGGISYPRSVNKPNSRVYTRMFCI